MNKALLVVLLSIAAAPGCGSDEPVAVDHPWARATSEVQTSAAVYFELTVDHDDVLVGAAVPASVAAAAEIHEVVAADGTDMDDMDDMDDMNTDDMDATAPAMLMREVTGGLSLGAGETVAFETGSYHVMLIDLAAPLVVGDEFELTLEFEDNDAVTVTVPVEETAP